MGRAHVIRKENTDIIKRIMLENPEGKTKLDQEWDGWMV
jgi:hypothetical protein